MRKCSRWGTPLRLLAAAHPSWNGDGKQGLRLCELIVVLEQKIPNRRRRRLLQSPVSGPQMRARGSAVHSSNFRGAVVKRSHATAQWVQRTYPGRRTGSGDERRDRRGRPEELLQVDVPADSGGTAALACTQLGSLPSAQRTVHRCAPYSSECSALCTLAHEARATELACGSAGRALQELVEFGEAARLAATRAH